MSGISRPQLAPDPFTRPATVAAYGGQQGQPGNTTQQQWQLQPWQQQQLQQQAPGYNPQAFPPMPGAAPAAGQQFGQQPVPQQQYQQQAPQQHSQPQIPAPYQSQAQPQQPQQNQRWSVAFAPGQAPQYNQAPQQPAPQGYQQLNTAQYGQAPAVPPKGDQYGNAQTPTQANPGHQFPPPGQVQHQHSTQQQQYYAQQPQQPQHSAHPYPYQQQPPALTQSPQQTFSPTQPPGHQLYQAHPHQQQAPQVPPPGQQWQQTTSPAPSNFHQQYQHAQQPSQSFQHPPNPTPPTLQYNASLGQEDPVSPIVTGRNNTIDKANTPSRPESSHIPSRTSSSVSRHHAHTPSTISSPPRPVKSPSNQIPAKPRRYVDPNGVGATSASALGFGGPSDWETLHQGSVEVDDLELYATMKKEEKQEEKKGSEAAPVELPAGSPIAATSQPPWKNIPEVQNGAVELHGGTHHPQPVQVIQPAPPVVDAGMVLQSEPTDHVTVSGHAPIMEQYSHAPSSQISQPVMQGPSSAPRPIQHALGSAPPAMSAPQQHMQMHPPAQSWVVHTKTAPTNHAVAHATQTAPAHHRQSIIQTSPQPNSFVITDDSGWSAPPVNNQHPPVQLPVVAQNVGHPPVHQMLHGTTQGQNEAVMVDGGWIPPQQNLQGAVVHGHPHQAQAGAPIQPGPDTQNVPLQPQQQPLTHQRDPSAPQNQTPFGPPGGPSVKEFQLIQTKLTQAESELSEFKEQAVMQRLLGDQSTEEVFALKEKIARLQTECQSAQSEVTSLERSLEKAENSSATAAHEKMTLETENGSLKAKIAELEAAVAVVHTESEKNKSELQSKIVAFVGIEAALVTAKAETESLKKTHETKAVESETALNVTKAKIGALEKQLEDEKAKPVDIAPGLDPWFKGSLERYRESLFREATAVPVQDKIKAFQDFVNAEASLRAIPIPFGPNSQVKAAVQPTAPVPVVAEPTVQAQHRPGLPTINTAPVLHDDVDDDAEFSPGGRPIFNRKPKAPRSTSDSVVTQAQLPQVQAPQPSVSVPPQQPSSVGSSASASPALQPFQAYRNNSVPDTSNNASPVQPTSHPLPQKSMPNVTTKAYKGFKYQPSANITSEPNSSLENKPSIPSFNRPTTTVPQGSNQTKRKSIIKPQEEFLPEFMIKPSGKTNGKSLEPEIIPALKPNTPAPPTIPENAALTPAPLKQQQTKQSPTQALPPKQLNTSIAPLDALTDLLPEIRMPAPASTHPQLAPINTTLARFLPSDFAFVATAISSWETSAAATRRRLDNERARRQAESEEDPNYLYNNGEIGYADISVLEDKAKQREAEQLEKEATEEWNGFLKEVFDPVYARLQGELSELAGLSEQVEKICSAAVSGCRGLDVETHPDNGTLVALSDALELLIRVHKALEERQLEAGKVVAERDRRYKKNITRGLYRKGQVAEMKRVEAAMDKNERKAEVGRRGERLDAAKRLWKSVKVFVRRGVDENERSADEILRGVTRIAKDGGGPDEAFVRAILRRVKDVMKDLSENSKRFMRMYEAVDDALNYSEFQAMLASERANDAIKEVFDDLNAQKGDQDKLLKMEARKREDGIETAMLGWQKEVDSVLDSYGGFSEAPAVAGAPDEDDFKKRQMAALEAAKKRNGEI